MRRLLILVLAVLLLGAAPAAFAHTGLVGGSPGPGAEVGPGAETIGLEFGGVDPDGEHTVALLDAEDNALAVGEPEAVSDTVVCARVDAMQSGIHAVEYSVTSDDGHVVQGRYEFEVVEGGDQPADLGCAASQLAEPGDQEALGLDTGGVATWIWWVLGAALLVSALLVVVAIVRSRRTG